jgi:hypothetical protein
MEEKKEKEKRSKEKKRIKLKNSFKSQELFNISVFLSINYKNKPLFFLV